MALTNFNNPRRKLNCAAGNDALVAWANSIPYEGLWDKLRGMTHIRDLRFEHSVSDRRGYVRVFFQSEDLAPRTGFLRLMFEELYVSQFNSEVKYATKEVADRLGIEEGEPYWWGTACFDYQHPGGGSNSHKFLSFVYSDKQGWAFND